MDKPTASNKILKIHYYPINRTIISPSQIMASKSTIFTKVFERVSCFLTISKKNKNRLESRTLFQYTLLHSVALLNDPSDEMVDRIYVTP